jgi:BMFP domain-containing protein YqiC
MLQPKFLEDISKKIKELISTSPTTDMEKNIRAMLQSAFAKLDLVTREEFDAQTQVLSKTREHLDALAEKVTALESSKKPAPKSAAKPRAKPKAA